MRTRKPTGEVGWPSLIIEGKESTWKTSTCLKFTADPRVGAAYVVEVGERRADEYAALGNFEIVEHNGSLPQVVGSIRDVMAQPPKDDRPNVLIVDSGTQVWDLVKREAERIAKSSRAAQAKLTEDPNADIDVGHQAWNKAKDRYWWPWLNELRAWPGLALITCRADEVSKFVDGRPVANQTDYRIEVEKGTLFIVDGIVRMRGARGPLLVSAKSLKFTVPDDGLELGADDPLAHLVFDLFGADTTVTLTKAQAKQAVLAGARAAGWLDDEAVSVAGEAWKAHAAEATEFGGDLMRSMLDAIPRKQAAPAPEAAPPPSSDTDVAHVDEAAAPPPAEQDPAVGPCQLCGSTRANTTVVDGVVRCMVVSACEKRQRDAATKAAEAAATHAQDAQDGPQAGEGTPGAGDSPAATQGADEDDGDERGAAEAEACDHVVGMSTVSLVAELASHGVAADVRTAQDVLADQLIDVLVAVAMGDPVPGAVVHVDESVAEQQALA